MLLQREEPKAITRYGAPSFRTISVFLTKDSSSLGENFLVKGTFLKICEIQPPLSQSLTLPTYSLHLILLLPYTFAITKSSGSKETWPCLITSLQFLIMVKIHSFPVKFCFQPIVCLQSNRISSKNSSQHILL